LRHREIDRRPAAILIAAELDMVAVSPAAGIGQVDQANIAKPAEAIRVGRDAGD
jgi:hypothetical protein